MSSMVHVGPRLSSLLLQDHDDGEQAELEESEEREGLGKLWHLLSLPPTTTLLLCCNNLKPSRSLPPNIILVEYGFQVYKILPVYIPL